MLLSDFDYDLPEERIAQQPLGNRSSSKMLRFDRRTGEFADSNFAEFPNLLKSDDLLVVNNTRVFPARLYGRRNGSRAQHLSPKNPATRDFLSGGIEVLLTHQLSSDPNDWECLVRPGRKIGVGERLYFGDGELEGEVIARGSYGERRIRFGPVSDFQGVVERLGHVPLPPYIRRDDSQSDLERYQTVYARKRGSVAAPTAGLHFTNEILERIRTRGIETAEVTLHVGLGTFQPLRATRVEENRLHRESYQISEAAASAINSALDAKRRIVAVGTTTVRTLEFAARESGRIEAAEGEADLFIYPGFKFRMVNALLTNFHLPESSLLMLVCAFGGTNPVLAAYRHAVEKQYRFFSYGDCMFLE